MPQASTIYATSRVRVLEGRLLTRERIDRMLETSSPLEAIKVLAEAGYGAKQEIHHSEEFETLILAELSQAYALLKEITPNSAASDLFLLQYDYHNFKALLKARLMESDQAPLVHGGKLDPVEMRTAIREHQGNALPKPMAKVLSAIDLMEQSAWVSPQTVDTLADQVMYEQIQRALASKELADCIKQTPQLAEYFIAKADLINVGILLRARTAGLLKADMLSMLLPGGRIAKRSFSECYEQPQEGVAKALAVGKIRGVVLKGLEAYFETMNTAVLERERDNYLLGLFREGRADGFSILPVIGYVLAREQEAKAIRLIMIAKLNGIAKEVVQERLRDLYV